MAFAVKHDRRGLKGRELLEALEGLDPVRDGHHHVEEKEVGREGRRLVDRLLSAVA